MEIRAGPLDVGEAFTFVTDDPRWVSKLLIGGGLALLGALLAPTLVGGLVVFALVFGYALRVTRNVIRGEARALPEWADWGGLLRDGGKALAVILALEAPLVAVSVPFILPGGFLVESPDQTASVVGAVLLSAGACLSLPFSLLFYLLLPVAVARLAATGSLRAALRPRELFTTFRANLGAYLPVLALGFATAALAYLGLLACFVGVFVDAFYAYLVNAHLYGQAYRAARGREAPAGGVGAATG